MGRFQNREEYEQWRAEKMGKLSGDHRDDAGPEPPLDPQQRTRNQRQESRKRTSSADDSLNLFGLFRESWEVHKERFAVFYGLFLLSLVLPLGFFGVSLGIGKGLFDSQGALAAWLAFGLCLGFLGMFWGLGGLISAVSDSALGIKEALKLGRKRFLPFLWLFTVTGFIVTGGYLLFFVPGIFFSVWFFFGQFVLTTEDGRGLTALVKSKEYVRGYGLEVFLRLFILWIIPGVLSLIPFVGPFLSILFLPFSLIFAFRIFCALKSIKCPLTIIPSAGQKIRWIGLAVLGYLLFPVVLIGTVALTGITLSVPILALLGGSLFSQKGELLSSLPPQVLSPPAMTSPLEGTWAISGRGVGGGRIFVVEGNTVTVKDTTGQKVLKGMFSVDDTVEPKHFDLTIKEATNAKYLGKTSLGIYQVEGPILTICGSEPGSPTRPSSYAEEGGTKCFQFKRSE